MLTVNHIPHLAGVNKQGFAFLLFVLGNKPKRNRNGNAVKELSRQSDDAFHKVSLNNVLSDFSLAAGLRGQRTVSKYKTDFSIRCKMVYHMLNPRIVGIAGRRCSVFPTNIFLELFLSPVGKIERRICHNKICFQCFMQVIEECICLICTEVCINATNSHIHFSHFPSISIGLLTVNSDFSTLTAVCLNELRTLYEHTARTTARVIYTTIFKRL